MYACIRNHILQCILVCMYKELFFTVYTGMHVSGIIFYSVYWYACIRNHFVQCILVCMYSIRNNFLQCILECMYKESFFTVYTGMHV